MKKVLKSFIIAATLLCGALMLNACSGDKAYKVSVKDALGNPFKSGIVVQFIQNGTQVAMQNCDANGVAEKELPKGDYTVALMFVDGEDGFYYEKEGLKLTASETELEVTVAYAINSEPVEISKGTDNYEAYNLAEGCTYVTLNAGQRTYFLFEPAAAGSYEFTVSGAEDAVVGYYGMPHYIQDTSAVDVVDGKCIISVSNDMIGTDGGGTSILVLGVDTETSTNGIVCIERVGDAQWTVADEAWVEYQGTATLSAYTVPQGAQLNEFDITASTDTYNLVYNETDGFYHMDSADGPLVLVRLTENPKYIDCFETITSKTGVLKYFWKDEEAGVTKENFEKKENYTQCLMEYYEYCDEKHGVYPLTEDLKYIIQQFGDHQGWFDDSNEHMYLFIDEGGEKVAGVNNEISWLFMCCYLSK